MHNQLPKSIYLSPEEIEARIWQREEQARVLPSGQTRRQLREEIARLQVYAGMKRLSIGAEQRSGN